MRRDDEMIGEEGESEPGTEPSEPLDLSIVVPVYNEAEGVGKTLRRLVAAAEGLRASVEIIVVDDGSTDRTAESLAGFRSRVSLVTHSVNRGYGSAIKSGMAVARGDWIAIIDADGTYPVERLGELWGHCVHSVDMVVGARTEPGSHIPLARRPAKWLLRKFATWLVGQGIPDLNSGFRIFRRSTAQRFFTLLPDGFSLTSTITIAFLSGGYAVQYVEIGYSSRTGRSKIRPLHDTYQFFMLVLRTSLVFAPLRFFFPIGFVFMVASAALVVYRAFVGEAFGVVSLILFVTGIQLLALGLLADLVNRRFDSNPGGG